MSIDFPIILASESPRRQQLLAAMGLQFAVCVADIDETPRPDERPSQLVERLSRAKARAVAADTQALVIAADTLVVFEGRILGKPATPQVALETLMRLRGRPHEVFSGLAILDPQHGRQCLQAARSVVLMRRYDNQEARRYVSSGDPLDKAGSYAIQHDGFAPVAHIEGCYANVMGFPMCHLYRVLCHWGLTVPIHPLKSCPMALREPCPWAEDILKASSSEWCC